MKTRFATIALAACLTTGGLASLASADTVNMAFTGVGAGSNVRVNFFGSGNVDVFAGQIAHTITSGTGQAASLVGQRLTYCGDFEQHVSGSSSVFSVVAPVALHVRGEVLGDGRGDAIRQIFNAQGSSAIASNASAEFATAFQLAVWEILYDYNPSVGVASINLTGGNIAFRRTNNQALSSNVVSAFNNIIASIGSGGLSNTVFALESGTRQDQFIYGPSIIPTPGTGALALLGAMVTIPRRRRGSK